ncbi:hypothetical protein RHMOL_Rhmol07G0193400 [Rhododendron molle]|uniref:Uncharacterized protein n=1 Tax=Rhododendron molle TaxID=49168 RepID=A0ACC0N2Q7_RHOML|nr:hypothetical protein RHMOL_Rhmol07G0193400 [Rhododendron molle]
MSQEISQYVGSAMTEIRDSSLHLTASLGSLNTNMNAVAATVGDLVALIKEDRKAKGHVDPPPQTPTMPHFGVFNGYPGCQPPGRYTSPQPFGFQASSSGGGLAHSGVHHQVQDPIRQNPSRPVENLERRLMLGGSSTPRPHFGNQGGGPLLIGGHNPHVTPNAGFMQDARGHGKANSSQPTSGRQGRCPQSPFQAETRS